MGSNRRPREPLPPCDGDCLNCKRPAEKCRGGRRGLGSPYADGTKPRCPAGKGDFGGVHLCPGYGRQKHHR